MMINYSDNLAPSHSDSPVLLIMSLLQLFFLCVARIAVIKINGLPYLCKTDEVGEICVQTTASGSSYWGLQGKSTNTFKV